MTKKSDDGHASDDAIEAVREALADYAAGDRGVSIDEAERLFRLQFPKPDGDGADDDATEEIRESLEDMAAGDTGRPWEEIDREFRRRNGIA